MIFSAIDDDARVATVDFSVFLFVDAASSTTNSSLISSTSRLTTASGGAEGSGVGAAASLPAFIGVDGAGTDADAAPESRLLRSLCCSSS